MGFREIPAEILEEIFGKNGCMEIIFGTLLKIGIVVAIGYFGLRLLTSKNFDINTDINTNVLPSPTQVSTTPTPNITTPTPITTEPTVANEDCVYIGEQYPNAFRAWLSLGGPSEVLFLNLAGPDGDPEDKGERINAKDLPQIVHEGDKFCKQR